MLGECPCILEMSYGRELKIDGQRQVAERYEMLIKEHD